MTEDGNVSGVWADYLPDKAWIQKIADFCQLAVQSAEVLRQAPAQRTVNPDRGE